MLQFRLRTLQYRHLNLCGSDCAIVSLERTPERASDRGAMACNWECSASDGGRALALLWDLAALYSKPAIQIPW